MLTEELLLHLDEPPRRFSPKQVSNLSLWLAADRITGLADAAAVAQWNDLSGNGNHAVQATGAKQPTLRTNALNGQSTVRFDGTDDLFTLPNLSSALEGTVFAVFKTGASVGSSQIVTSSDEASSTRMMQALSINASANLRLLQRSNDTADEIKGHQALSTSTAYIATALSSGAAYSLYLNGVTQTLTVVTGANAGDWFGDTAARDSFAIGALKRTTEADFFNGDIAEILLYDRALTDAERFLVRRYLGRKYGIAVS